MVAKEKHAVIQFNAKSMPALTSAAFFSCSAFFFSACSSLACSAARRFCSASCFRSSSSCFLLAAACSAACFFADAASAAALFLSAASSAALFPAGAGAGGAAGVAPPNRPPNKPPSDGAAAAPSSPKKYLEPDLVRTTVPPTAFPAMGEVVTGAPSWKALEPLMNPDTVPSPFSFHLLRVGTPRGAMGAFFAGGAFFATGAFFAGGGARAGAVFSSFDSAGAPPPSPNSEKVGRGPAGLGASSLAFRASCFCWSASSAI